MSAPNPNAPQPMQLGAMSYDPNNELIVQMQRQFGPAWKQHLAALRGISPEAIVQKQATEKTMKIDLAAIQKIAGAPVKNDLGDRIIDDLVKGAQANPRTGDIQINTQGAEVKLASMGVTPLDIAHMQGTLKALGEAGFTKKEASEYLQVTEADIEAVLSIKG